MQHVKTCNSFHAFAHKRMRGIVHIANTTMVLLRVPNSSAGVITYFLLWPRDFPILSFLELPYDYMQK